ncbi:class I SAM-dependent methyltransferase [Mycolicibacterium bacteremicum]|uniref:class I SAM-dependent methyltransferase n=1 Tax=Mycolicibacterium bacteremicum TaxID=564198 RepID=UPI0026EE02BE|nr:class I SAM-dependent methyltransferase [Mycolicibacterium bacteremicum]
MPADGSEQIRIDLTGAPQTMLATLYAKALDYALPQPVLGDRWAADIVSRIDYDWSATTIDARRSPAVTTRSAQLDTWVRQFLAVEAKAVVLHLGCGLDSRYQRIRPGPGVEWFDIDYPEVCALRRRLLPVGEANHHEIGASVTDPGWFADIPTGAPLLAIGEGLTMYLTERDGVDLLNRAVGHAAHGELQFDCFNSLGIKAQWTNTVVRRSGATLHWGIDDPADILAAVPGTRLLTRVGAFEAPGFDRVPVAYRVLARAMSTVPALRYMASYHRYAF